MGAFTFESLACLIAADVVYYYPPSIGHFNFMKQLNGNLVNLNETIYVKGSEFEVAYDAIVAEVMHAVRAGKKVAYAVQGSPAFHCGTAVRLHRMASREGFSSILISGVSSFELLSAELSKRCDLTNVQILSAIQVADGALSINAHVACLLFDLGRYALPAVREAPGTLVRAKLSALADRLRAIYPRNHRVSLIYVTSVGDYHSSITNLIDFESALSRFGSGLTIFLPAVRGRHENSTAPKQKRLGALPR